VGAASRSRLARACGTAVLAVAALLALSTAPAAAEQSAFSITFGSRTPGTPTSMHLYILYRKPSDPNGKPSEIRHLLIHAPGGTTFNSSAVPACSASAAELMVLGNNACPAASKLGSGTLSVISGFGPPFDPVVTDDTLYNDGSGFSEVADYHGTPITIGTDRITVQGDTLTGNPPTEPGGPPDGQSAVRQIDFNFPQGTGWVTTPASCPASGQWASDAAFTFADGTTQYVAGSTPCDAPPPPASPASPPHHRKASRSHRRHSRHHARQRGRR
jgi:hypothetical protein